MLTRRSTTLAVCAVVALGAPGVAHARPGSPQSSRAVDVSSAPATLPGAVWALDATPSSVTLLGRDRLARALRRGVNAVLIESSVDATRATRLAARARAAGLLVFRPGRAGTLASQCQTRKLTHPGSRCALASGSRASALGLARSNLVDLVRVPVTGPGKMAGLGGSHERVVASLTVRSASAAARRAIAGAISRARASAGLDLGVAPTTSAAFDVFLAALPRPAGDRKPPAAPGALGKSSATMSAVVVHWSRPADNRGVVAYIVYANGRRIARTTATQATLSGLACAGPVLAEIDAVDAAGNRSPKAWLVAMTDACPPPANRYVAPAGSDSGNDCTASSAPCRTFNRAYRQANPGDTVEIADGTYPSQTIVVDSSKVDASDEVVFRPASGADVVVDGTLQMWGSHAVFQGSTNPYNFHVHALDNPSTAGADASNHVTYVNLDGALFTIGPASYITIKGGDWGPADGAAGDEENKIGPDGALGQDYQPSHIVLDGLLIHDQTSSNLTAYHHGGLMLIGGGPITIRNSKFLRNVVYDIEVDDFVDYGHPHDVLLENNWFGAPLDENGDNDGQAEVQLKPNGTGYTNWLVRFNAFHNGFSPRFGGPASSYTNFRVIANTGQAQDCQSGVTYLWNVWYDTYDSRCKTSGTGAEKLVSALPYVNTNPLTENMHIRTDTASGQAVLDAIPSTATGDAAVTRDLDGNARPCGDGYEAGADEVCP